MEKKKLINVIRNLNCNKKATWSLQKVIPGGRPRKPQLYHKEKHALNLHNK